MYSSPIVGPAPRHTLPILHPVCLPSLPHSPHDSPDTLLAVSSQRSRHTMYQIHRLRLPGHRLIELFLPSLPFLPLFLPYPLRALPHSLRLLCVFPGIPSLLCIVLILSLRFPPRTRHSTTLFLFLSLSLSLLFLSPFIHTISSFE
ncbi:hypothetical protein R3P38DRAFT_3265371 [Favolaschia claudopus]|uniref:Uncharacterized protein n=1 Tax=Favolaschia claudopus TaxID=2862362 RepID=A0AAW0C271_9AGAR